MAVSVKIRRVFGARSNGRPWLPRCVLSGTPGLLFASLFALALANSSAGSNAVPDMLVAQLQRPPSAVPSDDAVSRDLALVAEAAGWTLEQAHTYYRAEQAVGALAARVAAERPELFVGSMIPAEPGDPPVLFVKGATDAGLMDLVKEAGVPIRVVAEQPYSFTELEDRAEAVHRALLAAGMDQVATAVDVTRGVVEVTVQRPTERKDAGASAPLATEDDILGLIPGSVRDGVELTITDAPILAPSTAFGGM